MIDLSIVIGTIGMIFLLVAFVLNLFKKITQDSLVYNIFNIIGAGFLFYYAYFLNSIPFLVLEFIWISFAIYKLSIKNKI